MSKEQLKAFLEKVKDDTSLQEQLKAASCREEILEVAKENGHHFSVDTLNGRELSDAELKGIDGGNCVTPSWFKV